MMDLDGFKYAFLNDDIGKEYQDAYADLHKLKSDFSTWLCKETVAKTWLVWYQQTRNKGYLGRNVVSIGAWKKKNFMTDLVIAWGVSF